MSGNIIEFPRSGLPILITHVIETPEGEQVIERPDLEQMPWAGFCKTVIARARGDGLIEALKKHAEAGGFADADLERDGQLYEIIIYTDPPKQRAEKLDAGSFLPPALS